VYLAEGSVNGNTFLCFIQRRLLNIIKGLLIQPFDDRSIVVFDSASIHHLETVVELISASGALVRFLPARPYSPDLNPIEEAFSKVKAYLRENQVTFRCTESPRLIITSAFQSVTKEN
jgi:transposase